ncbi:hypothetical protein, partial [Pseudomonas sp. MPBD7-1]|uniref:hypothetical protein n=1 Tax=Pseudomonas sp. MPBD7-1 TaxID=2075549 RepID=UPI001C47142A
LAIAVCQSLFFWLIHRYREQARSHRGNAVSSRTKTKKRRFPFLEKRRFLLRDRAGTMDAQAPGRITRKTISAAESR